jgi:hypothetical protein
MNASPLEIRMFRFHKPALGLAALALAACTADALTVPATGAQRMTAAATGPGVVYAGPENDYQPSLIRTRAGTLMMVIERLNSSNSGNLLVASSTDEGATWSVPRAIVASTTNERHPALVELAAGGYALFYLYHEGNKGGYRIHRSTSPDGVTWTPRGRAGLGWSTGGEINPAVIVEADGSLTMTYHRLNGAAYIARSTDGGATWDTRKTAITTSSASLPRIAKRASDGVYLVTYQSNGGDGKMDLYAETSSDPYNWTAAATAISTVDDNHDSAPIVMPNGSFFLPYIVAQGAGNYNVVYRTSADGRTWSAATAVTTDTDLADVEPHAILGTTPGQVILTWGHQVAAGTNNYDIWLQRDLVVQ